MTDRALGGRRAWLVWFAALTAYVVAVLNRTSFGVAGVEATQRFDASATVVSTFVMVQLIVYALMQVPAGLLLDRLGPRTLIGGGALLMAGGQLLLAMSHALPLAYLARLLIGAGDAATFISVIRLVAVWFPVRRVPVLTQLSGVLGQAGQVLSAFPLVAVLHARGWTTAFAGLAAVGVLAGALALLAVRDDPQGAHRRAPSGGVLVQIRAVASRPGTWLGFFSHALTQFPLNVFVLLWGFPFLLAQGLSTAAAGGVLTAAVLATVLSGPVIGVLTGRHPLRRTWIVLASGFASAGAWVVVLAVPGPAPTWMLVGLAVALGIGGPASLVGFDFARTSNEPAQLGTATGFVNGGGFVVAVLALLAVGVTLDAQPGPALSLASFRVAFAVQALFWVATLAGVLVSRRATRRRLAEQGVVVPPVREVLARRRGGRAVDGRRGR